MLSRFQYRQIIVIFLISRLALEFIGRLAIFYFPSADRIGPARDLRYHQPQPAWLEMWARWDSEWYLLIAEKGYGSYREFQNQGGGRYLPQETAKFFPLYPLAIRTVTPLVGNAIVAGILVSFSSTMVFLFFFHRLAAKHLGEESGFSSLLYILYPTSFYLTAVYSESLFLAMITATFYFLEEKKLWPALPAAALCMLTRSPALMAAPALLLLCKQKFPEKKGAAIIAMSFALVIPLVIYLAFVHKTFGSFRWIETSQAYWRGEIQYPFYALVRFFSNPIAIHGQHNSLIDFTFAMAHLLVLIFSFRVLPFPYFLYSTLVIAFPLCSTLFSFSRLSLINFPFFVVLAKRAKENSLMALAFLFALFLSFFMAGFANWYWVG